MSCTNCYNGCVEIVSDKCVRYTGDSIPSLEIETGDNLLVVEQALINKVISFLDGTGISITIDPDDYCELVTKYLSPCYPTCGTPSALELFTALVKAACDLQVQVDAVEADIAVLNANYTIGCLTGVTASSDTHAIVQAVITKLCQLGVDLAALALDLDTNYVKLADLNGLIQAYLDSLLPTQYNTRMVPYSVVEYYGPLSYFDITGAGILADGFDKIYLCNGLNGTPDKRGRVGVGAIVGVGGGALDAAVNPTFVGNPNYALGDGGGANSIILNSTQIPAHSHSATVTDPGHFTAIKTATSVLAEWDWNSTNDGNPITRIENVAGNRVGTEQVATTTTRAYTGVSVTNANTGGGLSHANIQPVRACYYIMYIP
jgi:microcystin-dependent protein